MPGARPNPRRRRKRTEATVIAAVVVAGAAAVAKWPHAWWWLIVAATAAGALTIPVVSAVINAAERRSDTAMRVRTQLQGTTGHDGGRLSDVAHTNLEARVHRAVLPIPYIPRDEEGQIRQRLLTGNPVLIVGSSMVGKTRMAAVVITDMFGSKLVIIPDSKTALSSLDAADISIEETVVWLDDIDRLIGTDGITDGALRRLAKDNVIVATIRATEYDRYQPTDERRPPEWDVLSVFEHVFVSRNLSDKEQQTLAEVVEDPKIRKQIGEIGIGEYTGAAGHIDEALRLGAAGTGGVGYALILGAANWRQSGMVRPSLRRYWQLWLRDILMRNLGKN